MTQLYTAGELAQMIIEQNRMDIEELGNATSQKTYIYGYMNIALMELAKIADRSMYSDAVEIDADGYVTFTQSGSPITNMFEPKTILMPNGQAMKKRTADEAPLGWWRESALQQVHVRGFGLTTPDKLVPGLYTLKYLRYPNKVTLDSDYPDIEPTGYRALMNNVSMQIKYSNNSIANAQYFDTQYRTSIGNMAQGSISARGTGSTGQPLGDSDVAKARGN